MELCVLLRSALARPPAHSVLRQAIATGAANTDFDGPSGGLVGWLSRGQLAFAGPAVELTLDARCDSERNKQTVWRACEDAVGALQL